MATFIISPLNGLEFKQVNNLLPNYDNTLLSDVDFDGSVISGYCQKFMTSETIITQLKSDYDTITATLIDALGNETNLPVALIKSFTDEITGTVHDFYEFSVSGQSAGSYTVVVKGVKSGEPNVYFNSESFEIVEGIKGYRIASDGTKFTYEYIPDHFKIVSANTENQFSIYYGSDRISGDPFETFIWIPSKFYNAQAGGEINVYENLENLSKLEQISQRIFELQTSAIPRFLAMKAQELASLDYFRVNDVEYVNTENGEIEYFANYTDGILTINLTQKFVVGINSDDEGFVIQEEDMSPIEIKQVLNASGAHQLVVSGKYSTNQITIRLNTGTSVSVKIGTTPSGDDILRLYTVTSSDPLKVLARNTMEDFSAAYTLYVEISGVGATADVVIQTLINKQ